jgi:hypothetical protein
MTAAGLQPDSWTLIVPINYNESELKWFDGLREKYEFPLEWNDRDWLDNQMSSFPDIRRYYLEGAADEVVRLMQELNQGEAVLAGGVEDAINRLELLRSRLNDLDPQYRIEISPGPVAAAVAAFPGAVMYQEQSVQGEQPWTISVLAKYQDAPRDRPIQVRANLVFTDTAESSEARQRYLDLMLRVRRAGPYPRRRRP